jgi:hypothetical protein
LKLNAAPASPYFKFLIPLLTPIVLQVWAMHVLLVRVPKCALEMLLSPNNQFDPFRALASIIKDLENSAVAQSMARVLHHAAAAGTPVASMIDLVPLVSACERLGCRAAVRDLLVALWQQNQNETDAAHNCLARMEGPEITKPHLCASLLVCHFAVVCVALRLSIFVLHAASQQT